ncbi:alpha/beta fold hydrolase [Actinokineospora sp. G85]|uniref:alpha/beta fold hydrolase n=1 Tax=Actinokineospora sp. G85 TaxID=3406626 RepID=UPI003C747BFD
MTGHFTSPAAEKRYFEVYAAAMAACPEPRDTLDVETHHGTTRVYRFGDAPGLPVVLLPGLMATAACYAGTIPVLTPHHPVYAVDTLGEAGRSRHTTPFADIPDRARGLDDVLAELGLDGVHLVGASTGGWHAVNQAIHAPGRVASISALDPTTVTAGFSRTAMAFGLAGAVFPHAWLWRRFLRWSTGDEGLHRPEVRLVLAALSEYKPRLPFQAPPAAARISGIACPVLALFGARSVVQDSPRAAARLAELLPLAEVETLPEAGHDLLGAGTRDAVLARVLAFLAKV